MDEPTTHRTLKYSMHRSLFTFRLAIPVLLVFLLAAFTQADLDKAKTTKEYYKNNYWKCLATEILKKETTNISVEAFAGFAKTACRKEKDWFFRSLIDYMSMLHPDLTDDYNTLASAANIAVGAAIDDAVKVFTDRKSSN